MKNKKELLSAAKNELADNERKYHPSLIEIEWLSPDELTELWPEWTVGDIYCEFLYMYFAIKESKDVRKKEQMHVRELSLMSSSLQSRQGLQMAQVVEHLQPAGVTCLRVLAFLNVRNAEVLW